MTATKAPPPKERVVTRLIQDVASFLLGAVISGSLLCFAVISVPLVICRAGLKLWVRYFRRDLGDMVGDQNCLFLGDYFARTPPRCNVVLTLVLRGHLTEEMAKGLVRRNWIEARDKATGRLKYERFLQFPVRRWGFVFWKWAADQFCVDNHIHRLFPGRGGVSEEEVTRAVEHLINSRLPGEQSPWEMWVVENYQPEGVGGSPETESVPHSVLLLKFHHCLTDGYGVMTALVEGLCEHHSLAKMKQAADRLFQRSTKEKLLYGVTFPVRAFFELSQVFGLFFQRSPFKVPDHQKAWYQVLAKSPPIPVQRIKDIKNEFRVSFSSVLMSAMAQALQRVLQESETLRNPGNVPEVVCLCMLPAPGLNKRKTVLTNHITGALVDLPLNRGLTPEETLQKVFRNLEKSKRSVIPLGSPLCWKLLGAHVFPFYRQLGKNKAMPIYLTNFASVPVTVGPNNAITSVGVECAAGGCEGETGMVISVVSYDQEIRIQVTAERALLSREETQNFVDYIAEEISTLHAHMLI